MRLVWLDLAYCKNVVGDIASLSQMTQLTRLYLHETGVSGDAVAALGSVVGLGAIEALNLEHTGTSSCNELCAAHGEDMRYGCQC